MANRLMPPKTLTHALVVALICSSGAAAQDAPTVESLQAQLDALTLDFENMLMSDVMPELGASAYGLGPAASKVYAATSGLSIGGYGELRYQNFDSTADDIFDMHRAVLYIGNKFNDQWVLNTEIELEHVEETFVEFAYLDYLHSDALNLRAGLMLTPMGLVNEMHEPSTYLAATRSLTESYVIPSTWRENGMGLLGSQGDLAYKVYAMTGMDGSGYGGSKGLRGGRQKGAKALAEDIALVASLQWTGIAGLSLGCSAYEGAAGQTQGMGDMETTIVEAHAEYRSGAFWGRALVADAQVDERAAGDMDLGGWYVEAGYDVLADHPDQALFPFARYEDVDTDSTSGGFADTILTLGLHFRPMDQVVIKLDHAAYQDGAKDDVTTLQIGYVF